MPFLFPGEFIASHKLVKPVKSQEGSELWTALSETGFYEVLKVFNGVSADAQRMFAVAETLEKSNTRGLVGFTDFGKTDAGFIFFAARYMLGGSLSEKLEKQKKLNLAKTVRMLRGALCGLESLHSLNMVHRDLKPANIFIDESGNAAIGDFGIVKIQNIEDVPGSVFGSAAYMSPEQATDSSNVTFKSDIFSLALIAYECLTGRRRYPQKSFKETLIAVLSEKNPPIDELREFAPDTLAKLIAQMMAPSPEMRPESASSILSEMYSMGLPDEAIF